MTRLRSAQAPGLLGLALLAALVLLPGSTDAARRETETQGYLLAGFPLCCPGGAGGVRFTPPAGTTLMGLRIEDALGTALGVATAASMCQNNDGDQTCGEAGEVSKSFCTKTAVPIPIDPKLEVLVFIDGASTCGTVPNAAPAIGSMGTVTATYLIPKAPAKAALKVVAKKVMKGDYAFAWTATFPVSFMPPAKASHVHATIADAAASSMARPTYGFLCQDHDDNGVCGEEGETAVDFCTATRDPVAIKPKLEVSVFVWAVNTCDGGQAALGSSGTVTATFLITRR